MATATQASSNQAGYPKVLRRTLTRLHLLPIFKDSSKLNTFYITSSIFPSQDGKDQHQQTIELANRFKQRS